MILVFIFLIESGVYEVFRLHTSKLCKCLLKCIFKHKILIF